MICLVGDVGCLIADDLGLIGGVLIFGLFLDILHIGGLPLDILDIGGLPLDILYLTRLPLPLLNLRGLILN